MAEGVPTVLPKAPTELNEKCWANGSLPVECAFYRAPAEKDPGEGDCARVRKQAIRDWG